MVALRLYPDSLWVQPIGELIFLNTPTIRHWVFNFPPTGRVAKMRETKHLIVSDGR